MGMGSLSALRAPPLLCVPPVPTRGSALLTEGTLQLLHQGLGLPGLASPLLRPILGGEAPPFPG